MSDEELKGLSNNKRNKEIEELDKKCKALVQEEIFNSLQVSITAMIGSPDESGWRLEIDASDPFGQTILFFYPRPGQNNSAASYIKPAVKVELGARPENQPLENKRIMPYAAEQLPEVFDNGEFDLKVLSAERTFWEKATILHDQRNRPDNYKTADRVSRHYYDLCKLAESEIAGKALENRELLRSVVENKNLYFFRAGANYTDAANGRIRLIPSEARLRAIQADYRKMQEMFFSEPPDFSEICERLRELEAEINSRFS